MGMAQEAVRRHRPPMTPFDVLNVLLPSLGLFYAVAAVTVGQQARLGAVIDAAIAGLSAGRRDRLDVERTLWLFAVGAVVGLGGLLLLADSILAAPVFVLAGAMQAAHFLWLSPRRYDVEHPVEPADRLRSLRAFALHGAACLLVVGSAMGGLLKTPDQTPSWVLPSLGAIWLGWAVWSARQLIKAEASPTGHPLAPYPDDPEVVVRVSPAFHPTCLFDLHRGEPLWDHEAQAMFPRPLLDRARDYVMLFRRLADPHDPRRKALRHPGHQAILDREGEALVAALSAHRPGRVVLEASKRLEDFPEPVEWVEVSPVVWVNPLWAHLPGEEEARMLSPDGFGISWALSQDLYAWAEAFDSLHDPHVSGRGPRWSPEQAARHAEWGRALAWRLAEELVLTGRSEVVVTFRPHGGPSEPISHPFPELCS